MARGIGVTDETLLIRAISKTGNEYGSALDRLCDRFNVTGLRYLNANQLRGYAAEIGLDVERITEGSECTE